MYGALAVTPLNPAEGGEVFRMKRIYSLPCQREVAVARRLTEGYIVFENEGKTVGGC